MDQTLLPFVMDDNRTYEKTGVYKVLIASGQSDLEKLQCTVQLTMFADGSVRPPLPIFCLTGLWINPAGKKIMRSKSRGHLSTKAWCDEPIMNVFHSPPHSISVPPPFSAGGDNLQSQILQRGGSEKNECLGGLKEFLPWIICWGAYNASCQKKTFKNKIWL